MNFNRLLEPVKQKIYMLIGRAILTSVNNNTTDGTQRMQVISLLGGTISDIDRFQEYGFESYPIKKVGDTFDTEGAQTLLASINGNRNQSIVFCVHDRRYRPDYLVEGEVAAYSYLDKTNPHRVLFKADRSIEILCNVNKIDADSDIDIDSGDTITIDSINNTEITSGAIINIDAAGAINITSGAKVTVLGSSGVDIDGGTGTPLGCVTGASACHFYGGPHLDVSTNVKASK